MGFRFRENHFSPNEAFEAIITPVILHRNENPPPNLFLEDGSHHGDPQQNVWLIDSHPRFSGELTSIYSSGENISPAPTIFCGCRTCPAAVNPTISLYPELTRIGAMCRKVTRPTTKGPSPILTPPYFSFPKARKTPMHSFLAPKKRRKDRLYLLPVHPLPSFNKFQPILQTK